MSGNSTNFVAGGTIRPSRFVKIDTSADYRVKEADANEALIGISQVGTNRAPLSDVVTTNNAAVEGEQLKVFGFSDFALLEAGAAIANGEFLKSDADGKGVPALTTGTVSQNVGAIAMETASASGELIRVQVVINTPRPVIS